MSTSEDTSGTSTSPAPAVGSQAVTTSTATPCECGCGQPTGGRFVHGHNQRGRARPDRARPESKSVSTGRWRAKKLVPRERCALVNIGGCLGRLEVNHIDKNPMNNDLGNLVVLCQTHHKLVDNGRIDLNAPVMPDYWIDGGGARRYKYEWLGATHKDALQKANNPQPVLIP